MDSIADGSVIIQSTSESVSSTPCWFGEVALMAAYLRKHGLLTKISEQVHFTRRRFGQYEVIDFVAVLARVCNQRRTHAGGILQEASAIRCRLHGFI